MAAQNPPYGPNEAPSDIRTNIPAYVLDGVIGGFFHPPSPKSPRTVQEVMRYTGLPSRNPDHDPFVFQHNPDLTCYRNSVVALLMGAGPFVRWLINHEHGQSTIMGFLGRIARNHSPPYQKDRVTNLDTGMARFWRYYTTRSAGLPRPWDHGSGFNDPADFLRDIFLDSESETQVRS